VSRFLLVELVPDLAAVRTTRTGVWSSLRSVNGVQSVTDLSAISRQTLDEWVGELFLPPDQVLLPRRRRPRKNGVD
jgi:hypothetical protein